MGLVPFETVVAAHHAEDLVDHWIDRDLSHGPAVVTGSQMLDIAL